MNKLRGFDVTLSNKNFNLCYSNVAIRVDEFTKLVEVPVVANPFPTEMFNFRKLE